MSKILNAISDGDLDAVKALVEKDKTLLNPSGGYEPSPLMAAICAADRDIAIIEYLVNAGSDVNLQTKDGYTALHYNAWVSGKMPLHVSMLLKAHGANTELRNHYGWTPLMRAALEGTKEEFHAMLAIGGNYDVVYPDCSMPEFTRGRPLFEIIMAEPEKVSILIDFGFKPTAAHLSCIERDMEECENKKSGYFTGLGETREIIKKFLSASK